jgi:hypothetical protein
MKAEIGVVTAHPIIYALKQVLTIFKTWHYCKKNNMPCNKWYAVYEEGTEDIIAIVGPLNGAVERASLIANALNNK